MISKELHVLTKTFHLESGEYFKLSTTFIFLKRHLRSMTSAIMNRVEFNANCANIYPSIFTLAHSRQTMEVPLNGSRHESRFEGDISLP